MRTRRARSRLLSSRTSRVKSRCVPTAAGRAPMPIGSRSGWTAEAERSGCGKLGNQLLSKMLHLGIEVAEVAAAGDKNRPCPAPESPGKQARRVLETVGNVDSRNGGL